MSLFNLAVAGCGFVPPPTEGSISVPAADAGAGVAVVEPQALFQSLLESECGEAQPSAPAMSLENDDSSEAPAAATVNTETNALPVAGCPPVVPVSIVHANNGWAPVPPPSPVLDDTAAADGSGSVGLSTSARTGRPIPIPQGSIHTAPAVVEPASASTPELALEAEPAIPAPSAQPPALIHSSPGAAAAQPSGSPAVTVPEPVLAGATAPQQDTATEPNARWRTETLPSPAARVQLGPQPAPAHDTIAFRANLSQAPATPAGNEPSEASRPANVGQAPKPQRMEAAAHTAQVEPECGVEEKAAPPAQPKMNSTSAASTPAASEHGATGAVTAQPSAPTAPSARLVEVNSIENLVRALAPPSVPAIRYRLQDAHQVVDVIVRAQGKSELSVEVRSADPVLSTELRTELRRLTDAVEQQGYKIQTWTPPETRPPAEVWENHYFAGSRGFADVHPGHSNHQQHQQRQSDDEQPTRSRRPRGNTSTSASWQQVAGTHLTGITPGGQR